MELQRIKEIRDCLTEQTTEEFEKLLIELSNNKKQENIPYIIYSLTESTKKIHIVEMYQNLLEEYMYDNPIEVIPLIVDNLYLSLPQGIQFIANIIQTILYNEDLYKIILANLGNNSSRIALIEILNFNLKEYNYLKKNSSFYDNSFYEPLIERTNNLLKNL